MFKTIALFGKLIAANMMGTYEVQDTDFDSITVQDAYYATAVDGTGVAFYTENVIGSKDIKKGDKVTVLFLRDLTGEEFIGGVIKR